MPYKNPEHARAYRKKYYNLNSEKEKAIVKARRKNIRNWIASLGLKCLDCTESRLPCLDFHHRDRRTKEIAIAAAISNGWSRERIEKEIEKCDVLCSNCHRLLHHAIKNGDVA